MDDQEKVELQKKKEQNNLDVQQCYDGRQCISIDSQNSEEQGNLGSPNTLGVQPNSGMPYNAGVQYYARAPYNMGTQYNSGVPNNASAQYNPSMPYNAGVQYNAVTPNITKTQYNSGVPYNTGKQYNSGTNATVKTHNSASEQKKKKKGIIIAMGAIVLNIVFVCFVFCSLANSLKDDKKTANSSTAKSYSSESTATINDVISLIDSTCRSNLGSGYLGYTKKTDSGVNFLIIKVCADGSASEYLKDSSDWRTLKREADSLCSSCRRMFTKNGYNSWHVAIYLLNDYNTDNVLYTTLDGSAVDSLE